MDLILLVLASRSGAAIAKLIAGGEDLTKNEIIRLGELNYRCHLQGYEPAVMLFRGMPITLDPGIFSTLGDAGISRLLREARKER